MLKPAQSSMRYWRKLQNRNNPLVHDRISVGLGKVLLQVCKYNLDECFVNFNRFFRTQFQKMEPGFLCQKMF